MINKQVKDVASKGNGAINGPTGTRLKIAKNHIQDNYGWDISDLVHIKPYGEGRPETQSLFHARGDERFWDFFHMWIWLTDTGVLSKAMAHNQVVRYY